MGVLRKKEEELTTVGLKVFFLQLRSSQPKNRLKNFKTQQASYEEIIREARSFVTNLSQAVSNVSTKRFTSILKLGEDINLQALK